MCILFLLVGDKSNPTVICNNRDEFYDRPTRRGQTRTLAHSGMTSYAPLDLEGGGTWISIDGLSSKNGSLRYAVVLNFHHWREKHFSDEVNRTNHWYGEETQKPMLSLKSRGLPIKEFMDQSSSTAEKYANRIYNDRLTYRPFNLIVSDEVSGTYYVSSSGAQKGTLKLEPGHLYAVTNGYIFDYWEKGVAGRIKISEVLNKRLGLSVTGGGTTRYTTETDSSTGSKNELNRHKSISTAVKPTEYMKPCGVDAKILIDELIDVMKSDSPLPDPVFHKDSQPVTHLGAIFVVPTVILRDPLRRNVAMCMYLLHELAVLISNVMTYFLVLLAWPSRRTAAGTGAGTGAGAGAGTYRYSSTTSGSSHSGPSNQSIGIFLYSQIKWLVMRAVVKSQFQLAPVDITSSSAGASGRAAAAAAAAATPSHHAINTGIQHNNVHTSSSSSSSSNENGILSNILPWGIGTSSWASLSPLAKDVFGTRTTTILMHFPAATMATPRTTTTTATTTTASQVPVRASTNTTTNARLDSRNNNNNNNDDDDDDDGDDGDDDTATGSSSGSSSSSSSRSSLYYIAEVDLDTNTTATSTSTGNGRVQAANWSTHYFTNDEAFPPVPACTSVS